MNAAKCQYEGICNEGGNTLAFTGLDVTTFLIIGVVLIALGLLVRYQLDRSKRS